MVQISTSKQINNINRFFREIQIDPQIGEMFIDYSYESGSLVCNFNDDFNSVDEDYLINIFLENFVDENNDNDFKPKILNLSDSNHRKDFREINYSSVELRTSLYPKRTMVKGEITKVEWYSDEDLTDLVLQVDISYNRDAFGFAIDRITVRKWVQNNGEFHPNIKTTHKNYSINSIEQIKEGVTRRRNIVDSVQLPVLSFMIEAGSQSLFGLTATSAILIGRDFMDRFNPEFKNFIDNSSSITNQSDPNYGRKTIVVKFEEAALTTDLWLNYTPSALGGATILQYLVNEFSI